MYNEHFGLKEQPFGLTPNTSYFYNVRAYREAFNMLRVALSNGEGFIKVVGEVGTGKTLLCRKLLNSLGDDYYSAYIPNPFLSPVALYKALAEELGVKCKTRDGVNEFQKSINERLIELVAEGKRVVLVIDEAQTMPEKTLEALRLISNLETETSKLIHIILFGQPELDRILAQHELRQLKQRITFSCQLTPLDKEGVSSYIQHRLNTAGYHGEQLFHNNAVALLAKASRGVPRLINMLCHKSLMCAYGKGVRQIDRVHVLAAINDTEDASLPNPFMRWLWSMSS
ncbi:AAA family ATPase [Dasania sp. GY-MA-18]|uniref:AAA family ATPase n=1 Tax=Dasania phycosphaerae TaxID=2950436 RepID=A0A9J6RMT1_9GAMM|nr:MULTISPECIES: AAA family ATPase [Dasania]MCR8923048.1 AAA family ATPase [Dasania sp. GY-MA-18]MCZ0865479.1 AAA family ATPase [Dasania phycosphaerae]MCZ0869204.1 AAA family ATPase [Dasania phycosphaerae]